MARRHKGERDGDEREDTYSRARQVIESVEFRVDTESRIQKLEWLVGSLRRWAVVIVVMHGLNWIHDLGVSVEMFDWWDGRTEGLLSSEFEHEVAVLTPLLIAILPVVYGVMRDRRTKAAERRKQEEE